MDKITRPAKAGPSRITLDFPKERLVVLAWLDEIVSYYQNLFHFGVFSSSMCLAILVTSFMQSSACLFVTIFSFGGRSFRS